MTDLVNKLAEQGRALPPEERVHLLYLLLESLQESSASEVDAAWHAEIRRRVAAQDRGEGRRYELDEVMAEAKRIAS